MAASGEERPRGGDHGTAACATTLPIAAAGARRLNAQHRPIGKGRGMTALASSTKSLRSILRRSPAGADRHAEGMRLTAMDLLF